MRNASKAAIKPSSPWIQHGPSWIVPEMILICGKMRREIQEALENACLSDEWDACQIPQLLL